jgi:hypothetical protein
MISNLQSQPPSVNFSQDLHSLVPCEVWAGADRTWLAVDALAELAKNSTEDHVLSTPARTTKEDHLPSTPAKITAADHVLSTPAMTSKANHLLSTLAKTYTAVQLPPTPAKTYTHLLRRLPSINSSQDLG